MVKYMGCKLAKRYMLPAQLYCVHRTASAAASNAVRASVLIFDSGLPVPFGPLHFLIFEANPKYLTGTSGILHKFRA